jgi:hypothetical protein
VKKKYVYKNLSEEQAPDFHSKFATHSKKLKFEKNPLHGLKTAKNRLGLPYSTEDCKPKRHRDPHNRRRDGDDDRHRARLAHFRHHY